MKYGTLELVYSSITVKELTDSPFQDYSHSILEFIEGYATYFVSGSNNESAISLTEEIMLTGIKLQDERIKVVNPIEFIEIWRNI